MSSNENKYQAYLIKKFKSIFPEPDCIILKNDPNYIQGIPDLILLINEKWVGLEVKKSEKEKFRPNQEYYISKMDSMSFARSICPENEETIINEIIEYIHK